tara:strand:+ start:1277 stop:1867 length:591 start_codon:yes stop_codon:yes gene_type:complete
MRKIIQFTLFCFIIVALLIFYKIYFSKNQNKISQSITPNEQIVQTSENNIIKNLKYEVMLDQNNEYIITADLSELTNFNGIEIIKMQVVTAIIIDENKIPLIIKSKFADYNNSNYNTKFRDNVLVTYMNHKIFSDKIDISFENNVAKIYENVKYEGSDGTLISDNIEINLITKKVDIFMDKKNDKVELNKFNNVKY